MKKAQGMSLNVIIVAVICIVVLVVLIMIFAGRTKFFSKTVTTCESKGGICEPGTSAGDPCPDGKIKHLGTDCGSEGVSGGAVCCAPFD